MRICGVKELTETVIDSLSVRLFSHFTPLILKSVLLKAESINLLLVEGFNVESHYGTHNRIERTRDQARSLLKHLHGEWEFAGGGEICRHKMIDDNYGRTKVLCITCNAIDGSVNSITVSISLSVPTPRTARFLNQFPPYYTFSLSHHLLQSPTSPSPFILSRSHPTSP